MKYLKNILTRKFTHLHAKPQRRNREYLCGLAPLRDFFILPSYRITNRLLGNLIASFIITALSLSPLHAQNINREEIRQDINIMENILEEMFETNWVQEGGAVHVYSGVLSSSGAGEVEGTFLPGFGIIFTIPTLSSGYINYLDSDDENTNYNTFENGQRVTKETIITKIVEFVGQYGSTIDQLSANDKIMVIYKSHDPENMFVVSVSPPADKSLKPDSIPTITVIAEYKTIRAFQKNEINKNELRDRLMISTTSEEEVQTDLKIMANILETAFDNDEEKQFQISGNVNYLKINQFGAFFSFAIDYGNELDLISITENFSDIKLDSLYNVFTKVKWDSLKNVMGSLTTALHKTVSNINFDSLSFDKISFAVDTLLDSENNAFVVDGKQLKPKVSAKVTIQKNDEKKMQMSKIYKEALQQFLTKLKETIIDYGPTLDSISSNDQLVFSIEINGAYDELPEQVTLQVEKSMLEAAERGEMSEVEALEEISVRKIQ